MDNYSDKDIIEGIRCNNHLIIRWVYKWLYPIVKFYITRNQGQEEDARDIFQEAMIIIFKKARNGELNNTKSLKTYIFIICKNLWIKLHSRKVNVLTADLPEWFMSEVSVEEDELADREEKYELFIQHFERLAPEQKEFLNYFFDQTPLKVIANKMGYSSTEYAKTRKYQFKTKLVNSIKADPVYQELIDSWQEKETFL